MTPGGRAFSAGRCALSCNERSLASAAATSIDDPERELHVPARLPRFFFGISQIRFVSAGEYVAFRLLVSVELDAVATCPLDERPVGPQRVIPIGQRRV